MTYTVSDYLLDRLQELTAPLPFLLLYPRESTPRGIWKTRCRGGRRYELEF